jgi:hypothetical protein
MFREDLEYASTYIEALIILLERDYQVQDKQDMLTKMREVKANLDRHSEALLIQEVVAQGLGIERGAI